MIHIPSAIVLFVTVPEVNEYYTRSVAEVSRQYLVDYCGRAATGGFPMSAIDLSKALT